jgi:hypothetical protein
MLARSTRRLPGFRFEAQAPPLAEALPRMDVAVFVGFAASGPIETPVAVESSAQFAAIFGDDAPLAWDSQRGTQVYAYLAPAVRAFFRNSGVRCWVVRVAGCKVDPDIPHNRARTNYFPVPGLARAHFDESGALSGIEPAFARGRAEGSWSDALRVATALQVRPLQVAQIVSVGGMEPVFDLDLTSPNDLSAGDLLRLSFKPEGYMLFLAIKKIDSAPETSPPFRAALPGRRTVRVTGTKPVWCRRFSLDEFSLPDNKVNAATYTCEPATNFAGNVESEQRQTPNFETITRATIVRPRVSSPPTTVEESDEKIEQDLTLDLHDVASPPTTSIETADAPQPGSLIRLDFPGQPIWMTVQSMSTQREEAGTTEFARVSGPALAILSQPPTTLPGNPSAVERLTFELWVHQADQYSTKLSDLGFESQHERFWANLPTDAEVYRETEAGTNSAPAIGAQASAGDVARFPLAGSIKDRDIFFPVAVSAMADQYLRPVRLPGTPLERDGLARFDASLFLDEALLDSNLETFLSDYEFVRYLSAQPRGLHGMLGALGEDEATIIAVPDAVHRGWELGAEEYLRPPEPLPPLLRPDWWHFLDCQTKTEIKPVAEPEWGEFLNCGIRIIEPPEFVEESGSPDESGTFSLSWTESSLSGSNETLNFILEESSNSNFAGARVIYEGPATSFTIYGRRIGDYYYHVRAVAGGDTSDWSAGKAVRVSSINRWRMKPEADYTPGTLLAVQRTLLRMCAARGDLFALLSLPEHYREEDALNHVNVLKLTPERTPSTERVAPLGYGEARAHSYAALYHPWLVGREENKFDEMRRTPPCGAVTGILAHRANTLGAWIAPANDSLSGVVSLFPPILASQRISLLEAQINLIQQGPRGFLALSADTLSDDQDYRPINVRRLLMLLRRMALRLGATYVFEPHSDAFRRLVSRGFNAMLDQMFVRGAFAGRTPATSYQVVADESLNTPQSTEQGRFIVELRVAPSLPMTFLTVRLVQTGDFGFVTEGRR